MIRKALVEVAGIASATVLVFVACLLFTWVYTAAASL